MLRRTVFPMAVALIVTSCAIAAEKPWVEIRSLHFRVLTNGSQGDARRVAHEFEQLHSVFEHQFQNARLESGAPLLVFAVRDEDTAKALEPHLWRTGSNRAGEFHHGWEKQFAIVRLDTYGGNGSREVVYHEYTHSILHMNTHWLPLWLDEGLAEFYAFTRFEEHRIYLGAPTERYKVLRSKTPLPVEQFIALNPRSPYYLDGDKNQLFYAEAWALVHYLTYGPGMDNGKKIGEFIGLIEQRVEQKKAFEECFGNLPAVDKALTAYIQQPTFTTTILKDPPQIDDRALTVRNLSAAETEAELGGFHLWTRDLEGAHTLLQQALKDDSQLGLAHENMGFLDFAEGKDADAYNEFSKAFELDGKLYLSLFAKIMMSSLPASPSVSDLNAFGAAIGQVLQLNPRFAQGYVQRALLAAREGDLNSALLMSRKAEEMEPALAGYHLLSGQILLRQGKGGEAAAAARYVADRWIGPDRDEAIELWNRIPVEQRATGETLAEFSAADTEKVEGILKSITCGDHDKWALVIEHDGQALTFHRKGGFATGYSDLIWYGGDHFNLCHHLEGLRAVVRYHAPSDATYAGDIVGLGIREDLPAQVKLSDSPVSGK